MPAGKLAQLISKKLLKHGKLMRNVNIVLLKKIKQSFFH